MSVVKSKTETGIKNIFNPNPMSQTLLFTQNCRIRPIVRNYVDMGVYELVGRHDQARGMGYYDTCREIQAVVEGLPLRDRVLIGKLRFYKVV